MKKRFARWPALALYAALVPVGVALRLTTDPLRLRRPPLTNWQPVRRPPDSLDDARRLA
jgi:hypothetical protein